MDWTGPPSAQFLLNSQMLSPKIQLSGCLQIAFH